MRRAERLLVVDDQVDFGAFIRRVARNLGLEVEITSTSKSFKAIYPRFDPTIITLDILMPDDDGIELVRWLARMNCTARIIIISGFHLRYAKAAESLGNVAGLTAITQLRKPLSVADLERALSQPIAG
jgi:CheY-like chemotaxis protein